MLTFKYQGPSIIDAKSAGKKKLSRAIFVWTPGSLSFFPANQPPILLASAIAEVIHLSTPSYYYYLYKYIIRYIK
jgi:hypothetical protein